MMTHEEYLSSLPWQGEVARSAGGVEIRDKETNITCERSSLSSAYLVIARNGVTKQSIGCV